MSHVIVSAIFLSGAAWLIKFDCIGIGGSYSSRRQPIVREESQFPPRKWVSLSLSFSLSLSLFLSPLLSYFVSSSSTRFDEEFQFDGWHFQLNTESH